NFKYELANQLNQMGRLHSDIGLTRDASKLHGQALDILKDLVTAHPRHELSNDLQRALAGSYENAGDAQSRAKQPDAALKSYQEAVSLRDVLASAKPGFMEYQKALAHTSFTRAQLQSEIGETGRGAEAYRRPVERQRLGVAVGPRAPESQRLLGGHLARL